MKNAKCWVKGCSSKGVALFRFPAEIATKEQWIVFCGRERFIPNSSSRICSAHFSSSDIRQGAKLSRLVKGSIPTLNPAFDAAEQTESSENKVLNIEELRFLIYHDHSYLKTTAINTKTNSSVPISSYNQLKNENSFLKENIRQLKSKIRQMERRKCKVLKKKATSGPFTTYQSEIFNKGKKFGKRWDTETIKRAIEIRSSCGARGYNHLRKLGYPLPSIRFINKRLQNLDFSPGILEDFLKFLANVVPTMDMLDRHAGIFLDEMSLVPGLEMDQSTKEIVGETNFPGPVTNATHALVIMVCGLRKRWKQVVCYYFTGELSINYMIEKIKSNIYFFIFSSQCN